MILESGDVNVINSKAIEAPSGSEILTQCIGILEMLLDKNISYGNSALEPMRIFSAADTDEQLKIRVDDKLTRIKNGQGYPGDNDIEDLIGYLILLLVSKRNSA